MFSKHELNNNQKKIVLLGMDDKEISPADIQNGLNAIDLLTYNNEVTELRTKGLLIEIRNKIQAKSLANRKGVPRNQITRFKVVK